MDHFLKPIANWVIEQIGSFGYPAVIAMMAIESACIPLPSEIIMPFSGFLVYKGIFNLHLASLSGALGCAIGSAVAYYAGMRGGRPFIKRYGKYLLIKGKDIDRADYLFDKYGEPIVFVSRLLPVIRTFISFPAGVSRMNFGRFMVYSFVGSIPWCYFLAYVGKVLGENWSSIRSYFHNADIVIAVLIGVAFAFWLYHHLKPEG
ncbi:MAG: DedA family protein [Armatimonadota bacterium]|nr:DedA family protein [Armatimonadota bacterium]